MFQPPAPQPEPAANEAFYIAAVEEMKQHLHAVLALPDLSKFLETKQLPRAFFEEWNGFLAAYDRLIDRVLESDPPEKAIACKKGCANCCIDLVRGINTPEIINIYHHVRRWDDCKQLFEYHRESAEKFGELLMAKGSAGETPPDGRDPRVAEAHVEFNRLNRPCGFLDQETGCCRIYPVRPLACRYFFSVDPPETCSPLHVKYLNRRTRMVHLPEEIHALIRDVDHAFGFRPLNYLSGAFCDFTAAKMRLKVIEVAGDGD